MRAETETQQRLERIIELQGLLASVAREIGPATDLHLVLSTVLRAMRSLVAFKGGTICLVDGADVRIVASDPPVSPEVAALRLPVGTGLAGRVISTGRPVASGDLDADLRVDQAVRSLGSNRTMKSYMAVPLICLGQVIGLMQVDSAEQDAFDDDDVRVMEGLATQVAGAIESARRFEQIMELEHLKTDFVARVSHELRTPLTIVTGFLATLRQRGDTINEQDRDDILRRMDVASMRLQDLIEELLSVTSFEAGMAQPAAAPTRVLDVLERVRIEAIDPSKVLLVCPADLKINVDAKLLQHALSLLVDNGVKYAGEAQLFVRSDDPGVVIDVRDHGPGIADGLRAHLFERFVRGDHSEPGMGLGLPLVKTLIGAMGGTVQLVIPDDGGSTFRVSLPMRPLRAA